MTKYYIFIGIYTLFSSIAALFLKRASDTKLPFVRLIFFNKDFYIGIGLYFLASVGSIVALKYLPYSVVYSLSAMTYIWTLIIARIFLKEELSRQKIVGVSFIFVGVFCITY